MIDFDEATTTQEAQTFLSPRLAYVSDSNIHRTAPRILSVVDSCWRLTLKTIYRLHKAESNCTEVIKEASDRYSARAIQNNFLFIKKNIKYSLLKDLRINYSSNSTSEKKWMWAWQHTMDHYKILQIEPNSTPQQIKAAYKTLARQYHPDKIAHNHVANPQSR